MFEKSLNLAMKRYAVEFSDAAIVFLHFCVVRGTEVILDRSRSRKSITAHQIQRALRTQVELLHEQKLELDEASVNRAIYPIIRLIQKEKRIKMNNEAYVIVNKFVNRSTEAIMMTAARIAKISRPEKRIVEPEHVERATEEVFDQGWFWW